MLTWTAPMHGAFIYLYTDDLDFYTLYNDDDSVPRVRDHRGVTTCRDRKER